VNRVLVDLTCGGTRVLLKESGSSDLLFLRLGSSSNRHTAILDESAAACLRAALDGYLDSFEDVPPPT
jgi:hypothetical protein